MLREPGPVTARIWQEVPRLERVSAADLAGPEEEACLRRVAQGRPCLLCGARSCGAVTARPRLGGWPVWVDVCGDCFGVLAAEA